MSNEPRKGVPSWICITLAAVLGGGVLCMAICGGVIWMSFRQYAAVIDATVDRAPIEPVGRGVAPAEVPQLAVDAEPSP